MIESRAETDTSNNSMLWETDMIPSRARNLIGLALLCTISASTSRAQVGADAERASLKNSGQRWVEFSWVDERAGDCHMSGVLTIFAMVMIWAASTMTESTVSGDWHESLEVLDADGRRLFGFDVGIRRACSQTDRSTIGGTPIASLRRSLTASRKPCRPAGASWAAALKNASVQGNHSPAQKHSSLKSSKEPWKDST